MLYHQKSGKGMGLEERGIERVYLPLFPRNKAACKEQRKVSAMETAMQAKISEDGRCQKVKNDS